MQIADGEYDIDISCLQDSVDASGTEEYFAIRYGFVPDSMDKGQSVNLYESENEYILEAKSTDNTSAKTILFEGNIQRYQPKNRGPGDNYILTMSSDGKSMALKKLDSMIRMNKTRNAHRLQSQIEMINKGKSVHPPDPVSEKSPSELVKHIASKRLPTRNSNDKNRNINSVSLEKSMKPTGNTDSLKMAEKPLSTRGATGAGQLENDDDDFRDLENELEEVLEEENQEHSGSMLSSNTSTLKNAASFEQQLQTEPTNNDNDDSEDELMEYMANPFTSNLRIEHEDLEETSNSYSRFQVSNNNGKKPMSLKDLVGSNIDDASSSEEE